MVFICLTSQSSQKGLIDNWLTSKDVIMTICEKDTSMLVNLGAYNKGGCHHHLLSSRRQVFLIRQVLKLHLLCKHMYIIQ